MPIKHAIFSMILALAAAPVLAAGHVGLHLPVPPASFLDYHVSTVYELSQEVTLNPAVRARLANHFHISEAQMTQYIQRNLVLTHLQNPGRYRVACVGRDGQEFWVEARLPKGTPVFASRASGKPILKLACGNPLVSSLPPVIQTAAYNGSFKAAQFAYLAPPIPAGTAPLPGLMSADMLPDTALVAAADVAPTVVEVSPSFESFIPAGASRSFNALPALLGALAVGVASTGHHGSTANVIAPPIPEASTSISLGVMLLLGTGGLFILRRKRVSETRD